MEKTTEVSLYLNVYNYIIWDLQVSLWDRMAFRVMHRPESDSPPFLWFPFLFTLPKFLYFHRYTEYSSVITQTRISPSLSPLTPARPSSLPAVCARHIPSSSISCRHPQVQWLILSVSDSMPANPFLHLVSQVWTLNTPPPHTHKRTPSLPIHLSSFHQSFKQDGRSRINSGLLMVEYVRKWYYKFLST